MDDFFADDGLDDLDYGESDLIIRKRPKVSKSSSSSNTNRNKALALLGIGLASPTTVTNKENGCVSRTPQLEKLQPVVNRTSPTPNFREKNAVDPPMTLPPAPVSKALERSTLSTKLVSSFLDDEIDFDLVIEPPVSVVQQTSALSLPRRNLNETFQSMGRTKVFRNTPQSKCITADSRGKTFFLKLKKDTWKQSLREEFASENITSLNATQSFTQFRSLMNRIRSEKEHQSKKAGDSIGKNFQNLSIHKELWVERFRPNGYLDLLSDETVNRTLLQWLKLWDHVVFRREVKVPQPSYQNSRKRPNGKPYFWKRFAVDESLLTLDTDKRPRFKAVLLCGQPGLGKTTLAHVIAKHAGYDSMEINASDDRTLDLFRNRVESTVTNANIVLSTVQTEDGEKKERKPKCLVIDEIDGAPANTIDYLVSLLKGEAKSTGAKKKSKAKLGLFRPIICICNDQFVPALRPLRQCVIVIRFPSIHRERLCQRLTEICRGMDVKVDNTALYDLCNKSDDDVRTCLNSLQFAAVKGNKVSAQDVQQAALACKDQKKQLFEILDAVFKQGSVVKKTTATAAEKDRIATLLQILEQSDLDKITIAAHENMLRVPQKSGSMEPLDKCAEWAAFSDIMERTVMKDQLWGLSAYRSFYPVVVHVHTATPHLAHGTLQYPRVHSDVYQQSMANREILETCRKSISGSLYRSHTPERLTTEIVPFLSKILQPNLKGCNMYLLSHREIAALKELVDVMLNYGLTFKEEMNMDNSKRLNLEPNIERIAHFAEIVQTGKLSDSVKEMVWKQLQVRKIETVKETTEKPTLVKRTISAETSKNSEKTVEKAPVENKPKPKKNEGKLQVWSVYDYLKPKEDPGASQTASQTAKNGGNGKGRVVFRYKDGYSNAVSRDVKTKFFM